MTGGVDLGGGGFLSRRPPPPPPDPAEAAARAARQAAAAGPAARPEDAAFRARLSRVEERWVALRGEVRGILEREAAMQASHREWVGETERGRDSIRDLNERMGHLERMLRDAIEQFRPRSAALDNFNRENEGLGAGYVTLDHTNPESLWTGDPARVVGRITISDTPAPVSGPAPPEGATAPPAPPEPIQAPTRGPGIDVRATQYAQRDTVTITVRLYGHAGDMIGRWHRRTTLRNLRETRQITVGPTTLRTADVIRILRADADDDGEALQRVRIIDTTEAVRERPAPRGRGEPVHETMHHATGSRLPQHEVRAWNLMLRYLTPFQAACIGRGVRGGERLNTLPALRGFFVRGQVGTLYWVMTDYGSQQNIWAVTAIWRDLLRLQAQHPDDRVRAIARGHGGTARGGAQLTWEGYRRAASETTRLWNLCALPTGNVPLGDVLLGQAMTLSAQEDHYYRHVNFFGESDMAIRLPSPWVQAVLRAHAAGYHDRPDLQTDDARRGESHRHWTLEGPCGCPACREWMAAIHPALADFAFTPLHIDTPTTTGGT